MHLNWLAIAVCAAALFVLGGLWFVVLFGKQYAVALGRENAPRTTPGPLYMVGPLVCSVFNIVASAWLMRALHIDSLGGALLFGAIVGGGYLAATTVNTGINPNIPRPLFYGALSGSYFFLSGLVTSTILFLMG